MAAKKKTYSQIDNEFIKILSKASNNSLNIEEAEEQLNLETNDVKKSIERLESKLPAKITSKLQMENSRWIIRIKKVQDYQTETKIKVKKSNKLKWYTHNDLPCYICPYSRKCSDGQNLYNPKDCAHLTDWMVASLKGEEFRNKFHPTLKKDKKKKGKKEGKKKGKK